MATKKATPAQLAARKLFAQRAKAGLLTKKPKASRDYARDAAVERAEAELRLAKKIAARRKNNPRKKTVSQKISQLTHDGYPQKQAVAVALSEMRKGKVKSNPASKTRSKVSAVVLMKNPSAKNVSAKGYSNWKYCVEAKRLIPGGHVFESIAGFNTKAQAEDYKMAILKSHPRITLRIKTYK